MRNSSYMNNGNNAGGAQEELKQRYLLYSTVKRNPTMPPDQLFMNFLYLKMGGNPLRTIHFIQNLVDQKFIMIKEQNIQLQKKVSADWSEEQIKANNRLYTHMEKSIAYMTEYLQRILELEDMLIIDVPFLCH